MIAWSGSHGRGHEVSAAPATVVGTAAAAWLLIRPSVLQQSLQPPIGLADYLTLAWIVSSLPGIRSAR